MLSLLKFFIPLHRKWFYDNYTIKKLNCNTFYKGNHKIFESDYQKEESIEEFDEEIAMLELKLAEKRKARLLKNEQGEM